MIVELALSNDRVTGMDAPPGDWLFQTKLRVEANSGEAVFLPTRDVLDAGYDETDDERRRLDLQYRHRLEFAIGRTCSVTWTEATRRRHRGAPRRSRRPGCRPPTCRRRSPGRPARPSPSMRELAELAPEEVERGVRAARRRLRGRGWTSKQADGRRAARPPPARSPTKRSPRPRVVADRLRRRRRAAGGRRPGAAVLPVHEPGHARPAHRTQVAAQRAADDDAVDRGRRRPTSRRTGDKAASWRPFQLAFILMQLPALTDPANDLRSGDAANVELLFFPTGGGKTEAYLGLAAYTFAIRRLQGEVDTDDGRLDGGDGVAVLMRYTLRLLTAQQFQRATALVCAAELVRREDEATLGRGAVPDRAVGRNRRSARSGSRRPKRRSRPSEPTTASARYGLTVLQIQRCPWCGTPIDPKRDVARRRRPPSGSRSTAATGTDDCPFSRRRRRRRRLPILTVDEEIYRLPPDVPDRHRRQVRPARPGGRGGEPVRLRRRAVRAARVRASRTRAAACTGHSHNAKTEGGRTYPKVTVQPVGRLRPPDLIIQDELHLITGALGTAVGLFEDAVDVLSSYTHGGHDRSGRWSSPRPRPCGTPRTRCARSTGAASTSSRRRCSTCATPSSPRRCRSSDEDPGRRYLGVCAHGVRLTPAEIRLAEVLLLAGQMLLDEHGDAADPYLTLVGYFNATRELAGMRRYLDDDVTTRVAGNTEPFPRRTHRLRATRDRRADLADLGRGHRDDPRPAGAAVRRRSLEHARRERLTPRRNGGSREAKKATAAVRRSTRSTSSSRPRCSRSASTSRGSG